jgi:hypothetical protein
MQEIIMSAYKPHNVNMTKIYDSNNTKKKQQEKNQ